MQKLTLGIAVLALIVGGVAIYQGNDGGPSVGGESYQKESFLEGFYAGAGRPFQVSRTGVLTSTVGATFDTNTLYIDSTNNRVGIGTTTPLVRFQIEEANASSTVYVLNSSTTAATGGRIILEDTDGAGCSQIAALNGTVVAATVTCP